MKILAAAAFIAGPAFAQTQDDQFKAKVAGVRYPPLAAAARVQPSKALNHSCRLRPERRLSLSSILP